MPIYKGPRFFLKKQGFFEFTSQSWFLVVKFESQIVSSMHCSVQKQMHNNGSELGERSFDNTFAANIFQHKQNRKIRNCDLKVYRGEQGNDALTHAAKHIAEMNEKYHKLHK